MDAYKFHIGALQHLEAMLGQRLDQFHPMMPGFTMPVPGPLPVESLPLPEAKTPTRVD